MATIYRFVVEEGKSARGSGGSRKGKKESKKKTGKTTSLLKMLEGDKNKGGVEANRKLRAINPLINKMTGGYWEKATRLGRAGLGLVKVNSETGKFAGLSGSAIAIIIAMLIQTYLKIQQHYIEKADRENKLNFKNMETGQSAIRGNYDVSVNIWNGKISYNENK